MTTQRSMSPDEEDRAVEVAILNHVLDEHPAMLRRSDLIREFSMTSDDWVHRDTIERAVVQLAKHGLLDYLDGYVLPTRAAVYCRSLGGL
jgi:hypothetical protein